MSELIPAGISPAQLYPAEFCLRAMEEWELLPTGEQDALLVAASQSVALAEVGQVTEGRAMLKEALRRAEDDWKGNPWGRELVVCHQEMLERFDRYYAGRWPAAPEAP